jgi:hypothetical protein
MLTADKVKVLTTLDRSSLARILDHSGYSMCSFKSAEFLGITNGSQFCYKVVYFDEAGTGEDEVGKVFVSVNANGSVTADF